MAYHSVSNYKKKKRIYLKEAVGLSNDTIKQLESTRANAEKEFHKLFLQVEVRIILINN